MILLVVLVLLALFTMMLITYVVATMNNRQSVTISSRTEQTGDPPPAQLFSAFMQVVRGPRDSNSVMGPHSLLEDIYGAGVKGRISSAVSQLPSPNPGVVPPPPLLQFTCSNDGNGFIPFFQNDTAYGFYSGLAITMLDGPAAGRTSRIVGYRFDSTNTSHFQVLSFDGISPAQGDHFLINGRPFSGTGFGYRPKSFDLATSPATATRLLDAVDPSSPAAGNWSDPTNQPGFQYALLPNPRRGVFTPTPGNLMTAYTDPAGPGGANEDYDAPDFQNMLLAMRLWAMPQDGSNTYKLTTLLPSLHRPDLIYYWNNRWKNQNLFGTGFDLLTEAAQNNTNQSTIAARNLLRKIVLRPLPMDHPNFTGSSGFRLTQASDLIGPPNWDIDNDGDGTPDSIWVDLGAPVQTGPDGRRYKPLFAVLCVDMDGKLNLNAHSGWQHVPQLANPNYSRFNKVAAPFAQVTINSPQTYSLRIGSGYGPAEISLHPVLEPRWKDQDSGSPNNGKFVPPTRDLEYIIGGNSSSSPPRDGRYGEIEIYQQFKNLAPPDGPGAPGAGISYVDDPQSWVRELDFPQLRVFGTWPQHQYAYMPTGTAAGSTSLGPFSLDPGQFANVTQPDGSILNVWTRRSGYGSPPDLNGNGMIALDLRGQPLYLDWGAQITGTASAGFGEPNEGIDDPYEIDLSLNAQNEGYSGTPTNSSFALNPLKVGASASNIVSVDAPFTAAEIERLLRANDLDAATLPDRLIQLAPVALTRPDAYSPAWSAGVPANGLTPTRYPYYPELAQMPNLLTTHSFDLPTPSMVLTSPEHAKALYQNRLLSGLAPVAGSHISQLVAARIRRDTNNKAYQAIDLSISQLVAPELLAGEKMNLNSPLGNGQDDTVTTPYNSNPVLNNAVDDPYESGTSNDAAWAGVNGGTGIQLDLNNDGVFRNNPNNPVTAGATGTEGDDGKVRQLLARYLYVLMMLLKDDQFVVTADLDGDGIPAAPGGVGTARDTAYYFAQWAINIVDFRDSDAIMTPFEFDVNPFYDDDTAQANPIPGTWDVDGKINSLLLVDNGGNAIASGDDNQPFRGLVWGAERPELLITETLGTHDRRTRDTNKDGNKGKTTKDATDPDSDYDQVRRPQGSLFIELFNPNPPLAIGNKLASHAPNELYAPATLYPGTGAGLDENGAPMFGVNLALQAPVSPKAAGTVGAPVWRLAVLSSSVAAQLTNKPFPARQPVLPFTIVDQASGQKNRYPYPKQLPSNPTPGASPANAPPNQWPANSALPYTGNYPQVPAGIPVIDRVAYFIPQPAKAALTGADILTPTTNIPTSDVESWRQFYPQTVAGQSPDKYAIVPPNRYAVIGPASTLADAYAPTTLPAGIAAAPSTALGIRDFSKDKPDAYDSPPLQSIANFYRRRIAFTTAGSMPSVTVYNDKFPAPNGGPFSAYGLANQIKTPIGIPLAPLAYSSSPPSASNWLPQSQLSTAQRTVRFSVTEPSVGYPVPNVANAMLKSAGGTQPPNYDDNGYYDAAAKPYPDKPYDNDATYFTNPLDPNDQARISYNPTPANADATTPNYTVVYLQRLANPLLPWDPFGNPYIVVDQMTIDVTMYNSEKTPPQQSPAPTGSAANEINNSDTTKKFNFESRQRAPDLNGTLFAQNAQLTTNNIWSPFSILFQQTQQIYLQPEGAIANSTLGYLNLKYGTQPSINPRLHPGVFKLAPTGTTVNEAEYYGDPTAPFPWFNWNDRPYVNSKELMLVPLGSPSSMLAEMTVGQPGMLSLLGGTFGAYDPASPTPLPDKLLKGEFGHLPNVFHSPQFKYPNPNTTTPTPRASFSPNFYRLLEYVHVPSRFAGTESWLPAGSMQGQPTVAGQLPVHQLHPPYNRVSRWRDPGRINLNTINDPFVMQGLVDSGYTALMGSGIPWRNLWLTLCNSRVGPGSSNALDSRNAYLNADISKIFNGSPPPYPSIFSMPFRSYAGHTLVPLHAMRNGNGSWTDREVDATMLRASPTQSNYPVFGYPGVNSWAENAAETNASGNAQLPAMDDPTQNPYFTYRAFRKLDNLTTTRSNVYAIWITVGYFEVTPAPSGDPQSAVKYPDGWVLGAELGSDTGNIERHRAFYMYDRTIPVGFERGENHNAHRGILLERFIE